MIPLMLPEKSFQLWPSVLKLGPAWIISSCYVSEVHYVLSDGCREVEYIYLGRECLFNQIEATPVGTPRNDVISQKR